MPAESKRRSGRDPGGPALDAEARIRATVDSIPPGRVASYSAVALEAGLPGRARLVGRVLRELPPGTDLAWHRVVNAAGRISARGGGEREQRRRLAAEGVDFDARGRIDLARFGWRSQSSRGAQGESGRSNSSAGR